MLPSPLLVLETQPDPGVQGYPAVPEVLYLR